MGCEFCKPNAPGIDHVGETPDKPSPLQPMSYSHTETLQFLSKVDLFKRLPPDSQVTLAEACDESEFDEGQIIIAQGETGTEFFVIKHGQATVSVAMEGVSQEVAKLTTGDFFGEHALLRDEPRSATITAVTNLVALRITREKFQALGLREKLVFPKRAAVGGGGGGGGAAYRKTAGNPMKTGKTEADKQLISAALQSNVHMKNMVDLNQSRVDHLIEVAWKETVSAGTELIKEGDFDADFFYVVSSGVFQVEVPKAVGTGASANTAIAHRAAADITKGGSFGELALLYLAPRAATVKAKTEAVVWVVDRENFKNILKKTAEEETMEYVKYIDRVEILQCLNAEERVTLAKSFTQMTFNKGEEILKQGEKGDHFYLLYEGDVSVVKNGNQVATLKATTAQAQVFGERALLGNDTRAATVTVTSEKCNALALDRESFQLMLGSLSELKARGKDGKTDAVKKGGGQKVEGSSKFFFKDLTKLKLLGCGGFGAVELVEHKPSQKTFALKALSKGYVVKSGMQQSVMSEKNVQIMCDSPFVIKLYETFNSTQNLYLLLELALGGELYATYNRKGFYGSESHAKYYVSGTVLAFEHLHGKKIIFRDLKPENLLLTEKGHVKLTDMGLAKVVVGKTFTTCGTPDYFAPELIESAGHNHAVDWWTLGILAFELMSGHPPFESPSPMQIYQKVKNGINKVTFPSKIRGACEDFVKTLCKKDPRERMPMKKGGIDNVKNHKWFRGYDWTARTNLTLDVPYKPIVRNPKDATNFSARKEDMPPQIPYKDDGTKWDRDFATSE